MKTRLRDQMLEAFSRFPDYEFIWRMTEVDGNLTGAIAHLPNVNPVQWMQQEAILGEEGLPNL
jgi:hypothetical protein